MNCNEKCEILFSLCQSGFLADNIFGAEIGGNWLSIIRMLAVTSASGRRAVQPAVLASSSSWWEASGFCAVVSRFLLLLTLVVLAGWWWLKSLSHSWLNNCRPVLLLRIFRCCRGKWRDWIVYPIRRAAAYNRAPSIELASCTRASTKTRAPCRGSGVPRTSLTSSDYRRTIFVSITKVSDV